ncbi:ABC transporter substrate-binding protein [Desulfosarcina sp. OttesenSCG-928-B08]|nr:ABC transporter substrate-binding protein [Desulfosarcina sp. OttesenSCG-928-B08]
MKTGFFSGMALFLMLMTGFPAVAAAAGDDPMTTIKGPIDQVISTLNDPQYKPADKRIVQRENIWKAVLPIFDFTEISRRTVGRHWTRFTEAEKTEFSDIFSRFLSNIYIDKIQSEYHDEEITYVEQNFHKDTYAEVKTLILRQTTQIPVNYRLIRNEDGQWKVYDIIVEGVSLVNNYRTQFATILQKNKPAELIRTLHEKVAEQQKQGPNTDNSAIGKPEK